MLIDKSRSLFGGMSEELDEREARRHYELKTAAFESILGPMHDVVGQAIVPFEIGGAVDMYYFPQPNGTTAFATMELVQPDGSGPQPSSIGTYELVAFTRLSVLSRADRKAFERIERRICGIFTTLGKYAFEAELNPFETCEVPVSEAEANRCLLFSPFETLRIGQRKHGLLLCIEVFRSEMEFAMEHGTAEMLEWLDEAGVFPFSDLDRVPVVPTPAIN